MTVFSLPLGIRFHGFYLDCTRLEIQPYELVIEDYAFYGSSKSKIIEKFNTITKNESSGLSSVGKMQL